jgi:hypothetical protein
MEDQMSKIAILVGGAMHSPDRDQVEKNADLVLGVLEEAFSETAIGPAVGCDLQEATIEMRFSVEGTSSSDVHQQISQITQRIDETVKSQVLTETSLTNQVDATCV